MEPELKKTPPPDMTVVDHFVKILNIFMFLKMPRKGTNFRWANILRDALNFDNEFGGGQFYKVYGRYSGKYKYHMLQRLENQVRRFNVTDSLAEEMQKSGNFAFYRAVCGESNFTEATNFHADLTRLRDLSSSSSSGDYLFNEVMARKGSVSAKVARDCFVRGFSRVVSATDPADWERFRTEMRNNQHLGEGVVDRLGDNISLVALSYKGKEVKLTRRMRPLEEDGTEAGPAKLHQTEITMTSDFVDDFRWSQLVRSCMAIARHEGKEGVRVWIDRLVGMGLSPEERVAKYDHVEWEDFGLFAYAVCPVVRLYNAAEPYYGTDFWRKLETVMGVAGRGIVLDDYMLRKFDHTIFFGPALYRRLDDGLARIGGDGVYIRAVTLALATAVMTDGVSVSQANEDLRSWRAVASWKAWALRTIAEGAYSKDHSSMLMQEKEKGPFRVGYRQFITLAFWESMVSRSRSLTGNSYLDMSYQRSMTWRKSACWDGIVEWIGMIPQSCEIVDRSSIMEFLTENTAIDLRVAPTGHVASIINLASSDLQDKKTIVVNLTRFSSANHGYVTAVAEATGLWGGKILPWYLRFRRDPDNDQKAKVVDDPGVEAGCGVVFQYRQMAIEPVWMPILRFIFAIVFLLAPLLLLIINRGLIAIPLVIWVLSLIPLMNWMQWPWVDDCDVGEAVFDNLLLHALYDAGIKSAYRRLQAVPFNRIGWTGVSE